MTTEQIETMLAVAWLEEEAAADALGRQFMERDRVMWTAGFLAGAKTYGQHVCDLITELEKDHVRHDRDQEIQGQIVR